MPINLISSTGALRFNPSRLLSHPVLVDADYLSASSEPDEIIDAPPRTRAGWGRGERIRTGLRAVFLFGVLQAAALAPPLYMAGVFPA